MIKGEKALKILFNWDGNTEIEEKNLTDFKDCIFIKDVSYNEHNKLQAILNNLSIEGEKVFDPKVHKKYYRYPNISLSRDKMDNCKTKYNMKKVLDKNKADFMIIGSKMIEKMVQGHWRSSLSSLQLITDFITTQRNLFTGDVYDYVMLQYSSLIEKHGPDYPVIIEGTSYYSYNDPKTANTCKFREAYEKHFNTAYLTTVKDEYHEKYTDLLSGKLGIPYISDIYMNNLASEDSVPLTDVEYKNLRKMLKGGKEDVTIAMTIMSNCCVEKSKTYLGLLFFHFSETLRQSSVWNQVGFKSLRREFEKYILEYNHYHSQRYSECIKFLAQDGALTVNAAEHLITIMFSNVINQSTGINADNNVFILNKASVSLSPEVKNKIKNNQDLSQIVLEMQNDLPF